ncbi:MAG: TRAP transporter small permease subunit [Pseudomonadota bacterium]
MTVFSLLIRALAWIAALLFTAAGGMLTYEVVARYFFIAPTIWAAELSQMALIWGTLIAMPWALAARRHIAVDALVQRLPFGLRRLAEMIAMAAVAAFAAVTGVYGFRIFWDSFERGRTTGSMLDLPLWLTELALPVGFALLFVQALIELNRARHGDLPRPQEGGE